MNFSISDGSLNSNSMRLSLGNCFHQIMSIPIRTGAKTRTVANRRDLLLDNMQNALDGHVLPNCAMIRKYLQMRECGKRRGMGNANTPGF